jgi:hypothetical protein
MLVPTMLGAILAWPWVVTAALMAPGFLAQVAMGWRSARARGIRFKSQLPPRRLMKLAGVAGGCLGLIAVTVAPAYVTPLFVVLAGILGDVVWRVEWRGHEAAPPTSQVPGFVAS